MADNREGKPRKKVDVPAQAFDVPLSATIVRTPNVTAELPGEGANRSTRRGSTGLIAILDGTDVVEVDQRTASGSRLIFTTGAVVVRHQVSNCSI